MNDHAGTALGTTSTIQSRRFVLHSSYALGMPAATSFKHVSPAGAAVYAEIDEPMLQVYEAAGKTLSKTAIAYLRSRQADPLCSFGDFVAVSEVVDVSTAQLLKIEVRDGIVAHACRLRAAFAGRLRGVCMASACPLRGPLRR